MVAPLVSVVIPAYNVGRFVRESVESALRQTHSPMEVLVINDGSTDDTGAILASYGGRIACIAQENRGLSAARNTGLRAARGEFIAFLDSDDAWLPEKTAQQLIVFSRSPRIGLVSCPYLTMDEQGALGGEVGIRPPPRGAVLDQLLLGNTVGGPSCVMVRRECLERVGLFDEGLVNGGEDWDYYLRVLIANYRIAFAERPLVKYRVLSSSMSSAKNAERMLGNELMVLGKVFADPRLRHRWLLRRRAHGARHFAAAWSYITPGNEQLPELRRAIVRSFRCYPPDYLDRSHLMVALHALLGGRRFEGIKAAVRRIARA